jgi:hypothetical protein
MNRYILTPIDINDPCWAGCHKKDMQPLEVEAEDESAARRAVIGKAGTMQEGRNRNPTPTYGIHNKLT